MRFSVVMGLEFYGYIGYLGVGGDGGLCDRDGSGNGSPRLDVLIVRDSCAASYESANRRLGE